MPIDIVHPLAVWSGHQSNVKCLVPLPDGCLSCSADHTVRKWTSAGRTEYVCEHDGPVNHVAHGHEIVLSASADRFNSLGVWAGASGEQLGKLRGHSAPINYVAGCITKHAVTASADRSLRVWDLETLACLHVLHGHGSYVNRVVITDRNDILSGGADGSLILWDTKSGKRKKTFDAHNIWVTALFAVGQWGFSGYADGTLRMWNLYGDPSSCAAELKAHQGPVNRIVHAGSSRKTVISCSADGGLVVWDVHRNEHRKVHTGSDHCIRDLQVNALDQATTGSEDNIMRHWDLKTGACLAEFIGHRESVGAVCLMFGQQAIVSASDDGDLMLWAVPRAVSSVGRPAKQQAIPDSAIPEAAEVYDSKRSAAEQRVTEQNREAVTGRGQDSQRTSTNGPLLFVSYARPDADLAAAVVSFLTAAGYNTWFDKKDLLGGRDWEYDIRKRISEAALVLVCLSTRSVDRKGFFHAEMRYAIKEAFKNPKGTVYVIPLRLDSCDLPDELQQWHALDLRQADASHVLLRSVDAALGRESTALASAHDALRLSMEHLSGRAG